MRILLIAHNVAYGDGQGRINLEIVRRALARGYTVTIAGVDVDKEVVELGARWQPIVVRRRPILARIIQFARAADRFVDTCATEEPYDAIVANGFTLTRPHDLNLCQFVHAAWLAADGGRAARGPVDRIYQELFTRYNLGRERVAYSAARHIVTPSHRTARELGEVGVPPSKIEVIPNGVDLKEFYPGAVDREALQLPRNGPVLLFVGDLRTNRKGLRYVLEAVAKLPNVHLAVVGRLERSPFPAIAQRLGISERVSFLGFRRDVAQIMRSCDLFMFPSVYDPFGMVVTEALASGLPVVTSAATGASELINERCGTVLVDPTDADGIGKAITSWINEPARIAAAKQECIRVASNHTWARMADGYLDRLISLGKTPRAN